MAAAIYARGAMHEPAIAALGLTGGAGLIFGVAATALVSRRCWGRAAAPGRTATTGTMAAGTGRPAALATSESTVALTDLCGGASHAHAGAGPPSPAKAYVAVVQPSGGSFAVALVADGSGAAGGGGGSGGGGGGGGAIAASGATGEAPPALGPLDPVLASPLRPRPSADGLQPRRGGAAGSEVVGTEAAAS